MFIAHPYSPPRRSGNVKINKVVPKWFQKSPDFAFRSQTSDSTFRCCWKKDAHSCALLRHTQYSILSEYHATWRAGVGSNTTDRAKFYIEWEPTMYHVHVFHTTLSYWPLDMLVFFNPSLSFASLFFSKSIPRQIWKYRPIFLNIQTRWQNTDRPYTDHHIPRKICQ